MHKKRMNMKKFYLYFFPFFFCIQATNSFLIISMSLVEVDDCIMKIYLEDNTILYNKDSMADCFIDTEIYKDPLFTPIPYDIRQKIYIEVGDVGGACGVKIIVHVNNNDIINEDKKFWYCDNCEGDDNVHNYIYNEQNRFDCYQGGNEKYDTKEGKFWIFKFYFQIKSISELGFSVSEYSYYLTKQNYFNLSPSNINEKINLINLHSIEILYTKNDYDKITPYYDYICYKLIFDQLFSYEGKFIGTDKEDNDIKLNESVCSRISETKRLRYELSESEKKKKGVHLKLKIGIYNNQNKQVSDLQDFNFFICLNEFQACDIETSMKCLNEGYYKSNELNNRCYSCYETCKDCNTHQKPEHANYFKNYCDSCKSEFPFYVNMEETDENGYKKNYYSCYEKCPFHAPQLKELEGNECVSYCPRYKTSEGKCLDHCDYELCKYLFNENKCYNYIPSNYFIYINNYDDKYHDKN